MDTASTAPRPAARSVLTFAGCDHRIDRIQPAPNGFWAIRAVEGRSSRPINGSPPSAASSTQPAGDAGIQKAFAGVATAARRRLLPAPQRGARARRRQQGGVCLPAIRDEGHSSADTGHYRQRVLSTCLMPTAPAIAQVMMKARATQFGRQTRRRRTARYAIRRRDAAGQRRIPPDCLAREPFFAIAVHVCIDVSQLLREGVGVLTCPFKAHQSASLNARTPDRQGFCLSERRLIRVELAAERISPSESGPWAGVRSGDDR